MPKLMVQLISRLTHWCRDKVASISQTTLSNAFSWMKMFEFRLKFYWSLSLRSDWQYSTLFQIMAWRRPGDKPLSEPMMVSSLTHIWFTRHQWVNLNCFIQEIKNISQFCYPYSLRFKISLRPSCPCFLEFTIILSFPGHVSLVFTVSRLSTNVGLLTI